MQNTDVARAVASPSLGLLMREMGEWYPAGQVSEDSVCEGPWQLLARGWPSVTLFLLVSKKNEQVVRGYQAAGSPTWTASLAERMQAVVGACAGGRG